MGNNKNIGFKLRNIVTEQYATFEDSDSGEKYDLQADLQFSIAAKHRIVGCRMNFRFLSPNPVVVVTVLCNFEIEETSWLECVESGHRIILPKHLLEHLCVVTVGTARGILHAKTENTAFNRFMIPTMNVTTLVEKDISFDIV